MNGDLELTQQFPIDNQIEGLPIKEDANSRKHLFGPTVACFVRYPDSIDIFLPELKLHVDTIGRKHCDLRRGK